MATNPAVPALVTLVNELMERPDPERFYNQLRERYTEGTLVRLLEESEDFEIRYATIAALGFIGTGACTAAIARYLTDEDKRLRKVAERVLGPIWLRADSHFESIRMFLIGDLIAGHQWEHAIMLATKVIEAAPEFAEAYYQRAIAYRRTKQWPRSIADCKKALELNPCHFGAMLAMGKCYLKLGDVENAIESFERALRMNRNLENLQLAIDHLRATQ